MNEISELAYDFCVICPNKSDEKPHFIPFDVLDRICYVVCATVRLPYRKVFIGLK